MAIGKNPWEMNSRFTFEECYFVYLVRLEGGCVLPSPAKSNFVFKQVLFSMQMNRLKAITVENIPGLANCKGVVLI